MLLMPCLAAKPERSQIKPTEPEGIAMAMPVATVLLSEGGILTFSVADKSRPASPSRPYFGRTASGCSFLMRRVTVMREYCKFLRIVVTRYLRVRRQLLGFLNGPKIVVCKIYIVIYLFLTLYFGMGLFKNSRNLFFSERLLL